MIPNKIYQFLGYNNLALIMEQERKHWLLKTDNNKQVQDKNTGNIFQGKIDNLGSDIILSTDKLPIQNDIVQTTKYFIPEMNNVLGVYTSTLPYSSSVNGLLFSRILSTSFMLNIGSTVSYRNYILKMTNCTEVIIPFGGSVNTSEVFATKWLKTTTIPTILMMDDTGSYTIERSLNFDSNTTNPVFYFPLNETLQVLDIFETGVGTYITEAINDDGYIGYPLYWFTCDQSNIGPTLSFNNNTNPNDDDMLFIGNEGKASRYLAKIYTGISGDSMNGTPDGSSTEGWVIYCHSSSGYLFNNTLVDYNVPLSLTLTFFNTNDNQSYDVTINCDYGTIKLINNIGWEYVDQNTYKINMKLFDVNTITDMNTPLIGMLNVHFDESIPFYKTTTDIGFAGACFGSTNTYSDIYPRYPHDLNKWDGLPAWMNDLEDGQSPQHVAVYAIHNTPTYSPDIPQSRQVAALLLDPGLQKTNDDNDELTNDERGRVYILSNDDIVYENNAKSDYPKPERTAARICDIPTSVMQLSNISGLAPTSIVDKEYVRSEASYTLDDKNRLINVVGNRWVRPIDLDADGNPITDNINSDNDYVFTSEYLLKMVDLVDHNNYRYISNINPTVDPENVKLGSITNKGVGYAVNDLGVVVIGGFAFHYIVTEIGDNGECEDIEVAPASDVFINLSNFNMMEGVTGLTQEYGSSPLTGNGTGLRFRFIINEYESILSYKSEIYNDLIALVKSNNGLWLYSYVINESSTSSPKQGDWVQTVLISEYEQSSTSSTAGLSTSESYINSIIPTLQELPVNLSTNKTAPSTVLALATSNFVNIVDKTKSPISNVEDTINVDMCKFYCNGISQLRAQIKTTESVLSTLKTNNRLRYDAYVFWTWVSPSDPNNTYFNYGIIYRSFNNLQSTDITTTLPINELKYKSFVHTNSATTLFWDVDKVGSMMWIYNPTYQKREVYNINQSTRDINISKIDLSWKDIDIRDTTTGSNIQLVDPTTNKLRYNIMTNNPIQTTSVDPSMINPDPIYQQPEFIQFDDLKKDALYTNIIQQHQPMGNWQLVFPRVPTYTFTNGNTTVNPIKLQTLKGSFGSLTNITDEYGNNVNEKSVVIDTSSTGTSIKIYNPTNQTWDII